MSKVLTLGVAEYVLMLRDEMSKVAARAMDDVGFSGDRLGRNFDRLGTSAMVMGGAIVGGLGLAAKAAIDFESGISRIATLGVDNLDDIRETVLDVAATFGLDLADSANAAYDAISAGVPAAEIPLFLAEAAKAAAAGVTDLSTAVDLGTNITNAFGREYSNVNEIFDQAFLAAKFGKTTIGALAASIGDVAPVAKATGVETDALFSAIAAGTLAGIDTSKSITGLKAALSNIIKPTSDAQKMADELGITFDVSTLKTKGLSGFLDMLKEATGGNIDTMGQLFGSVEGLNLMMALTGAQSEDFNTILEAMKEKTFGVNEAFAAFKENNAGFAMEQFKAELQVIAVLLGETLLPSLTKVLEVIKPILEWLRDFSKEHPDITAGFVGVAVGVGSLGLAAGALIKTLGFLKIAFSPITKALTFLGGLLFGGGAGAAGGAAGGAMVAGGAAGGAAAGGAAAGGGLIAGVIAFGAAWAPFVGIAVGVTGALLWITGAAKETDDAFKEYEESQKRLDETERKYIETLRAKGVAISEAALASMNFSERQSYYAQQEQREADATLRAWMMHYTGRVETEAEFAQAKNLLLNKNLNAEQAAAIAVMDISNERKAFLMRANEEETRGMINELGLQESASADVHEAIAYSAQNASMDRQDAFLESSRVIAETEQELGSATMEVWKGIVSYISEWYQWIKSLIADVWNSLPSFSGPSQPAIPQMATGGLVTGTGLVQVHKDELLVLPRGAEVIPKSHTANVAKAMQGGGDGVSVNITGNIVLSSNMDVDQVGRRLGRAVRREMQLRGVSLG